MRSGIDHEMDLQMTVLDGINQCHLAKRKNQIRAWLLLFLNSFLMYLFFFK